MDDHPRCQHSDRDRNRLIISSAKTKGDMLKHVAFFGTPDWIRTSGLQSRSYQAVKRGTLYLQGFRWFCTNLSDIYRKAWNPCGTELHAFSAFSEIVVK